MASLTKKQKKVLLPCDFARDYDGLKAEPIIKVDVQTGKILVFRWPWEPYSRRKRGFT